MILPGTTLENGAIVLDAEERREGIFVCLCFWASNRKSFVVWTCVRSDDLSASGGYYHSTIQAATRTYALKVNELAGGDPDENRVHRVPRGWDKV